MFPTVEDACRAAYVLREETGVDAVEMFDPACLRECKANDAMVRLVHGLERCDGEATSLLIECRGKEQTMLTANIDEVINCLRKYESTPPPVCPSRLSRQAIRTKCQPAARPQPPGPCAWATHA
jgi:hypothetical protein